SVKLWRDGAEAAAVRLGARVNDVALTRDGRRIAAALGDGTVRILDVASATEERRLAGHVQGVEAVAFAPDGTRAASGGGDRVVRLWDLEVPATRRPQPGHAPQITGIAVTADGRIVSTAADRSLLVWDAKTGAQAHNRLLAAPATIRHLEATGGS